MDHKTLYQLKMKKYLFILFTLFGCSLSFGQSFEGTWEGSLEIQGMELPLVFELKYDGEWKGTMQSPKQSKQKAPLSSIKASADSIYIEVKMIGLKYAGKLSSDKQAIDGIIQQGGLKAPMRMLKKDPATIVTDFPKVRSQKVNPPYSYDTLDIQFPNTAEKIKFAGTITKSKGEGRYPAVVLVNGSGPLDRNSAMYGHEPFKVLADYLTKQGIVVLRYDERGVGKSEGDFKTATSADLGKDALAAIKYLRTQSNVDPKKVGIIGHSEGGLIAFLLAGQRIAGLDYIVSLAGPAIRIDSLMILQNEALAKNSGTTIDPKQLAMIKRNYEISKSNLSTEKAFEAIMTNMKVIPGSQEADFADQIAVLITPWYRYFLKIDPTTFIRKIKVPVFAAYGGKDIQVTSTENLESLTDNLAKHPKNEIKLYPNLNHLMQPAKTGGIGEYPEIPISLDPELMKDIANWIKAL